MNTQISICTARKTLAGSFLCGLLTAFAPVSGVAQDAALEELREMVIALQAEVSALKAQLAGADSRAPSVTTAEPAVKAPGEVTAQEPTVTTKYGIGVHGYFKLDAFHDSALTSHQEIPFWAMPVSEYNNGAFDMTMKETRLGLDFDGPVVRGGKLGGKLEMDFYGKVTRPGSYGSDHAYQLRTRHAYLNWAFDDWSILAGKTWEPYIISIPETLNFAYYNFQGQIGFRKTQLRLTREFDLGGESSITWVNALLDPWGGFCGADLDGDGQDDATDAGLPVFSSKLSYKLPLIGQRPAEFAFSAVYGKERFDVYDRDFDVWAVSGGFVMPLSDTLTWKLSMYRGANLDSLWGNIAQGISGLHEVGGAGGWTQLQFKATDALRLNLGYSVDDPADEDLAPLARGKNQVYLLNGYYDLGPSVLLGLEYMNLQTSYVDSATATDHRLQSSLIYKF